MDFKRNNDYKSINWKYLGRFAINKLSYYISFNRFIKKNLRKANLTGVYLYFYGNLKILFKLLI